MNGDVLDGRVVVNLDVDASVAGRVGNEIGRIGVEGVLIVLAGRVGVGEGGTEDDGALRSYWRWYRR